MTIQPGMILGSTSFAIVDDIDLLVARRCALIDFSSKRLRVDGLQ